VPPITQSSSVRTSRSFRPKSKSTSEWLILADRHHGPHCQPAGPLAARHLERRQQHLLAPILLRLLHASCL
jgi:hypothetical protein